MDDNLMSLVIAAMDLSGAIGGCCGITRARCTDQILQAELDGVAERIAQAQGRLARIALPYRYGVKSLELSLGICGQWRVAINHYLATNDRKPLEVLASDKPTFSEVLRREVKAMILDEFHV